MTASQNALLKALNLISFDIIFCLFQVSPDHKGPVVEMGIAGHRVHGAQQTTPELRNLLSQFPPWAVTSGWCATYKSYTF